MTDFVNIIAVDPTGQDVVLLRKNKGPDHLIGKDTFPGGKDDEDDASPAVAAVRELGEEAGVEIGDAAVVMVHSKVAKFGPLKTFFVACDISKARTMETEVISIGKIDAVLAAARHPETANSFAPDFLELFEPALPLIHRLRAATAAGVAPESLETYMVRPGAIRASCDVVSPHESKPQSYVYLNADSEPRRSPATQVSFAALPKSVQDAVKRTFAARFAMSGAEQDAVDWAPYPVTVPKQDPVPVNANPEQAPHRRSRP